MFIRPGYHLHEDHWKRTSLVNWRDEYMKSPALRPCIDRQLRKALAWRWPKEGASLTQKHRDWLSWLPDLPRLVLALGVMQLSCPDYLLLAKYRNVLMPHLDTQTLNQLAGIWQGTPQQPAYAPEDLLKGALQMGIRLFSHQNEQDWVWNMVRHTLPSGSEGEVSDVSAEYVYKQMHRLRKFI
nr:type III secretion system domain-containing protein [Enterobacter asburiae]